MAVRIKRAIYSGAVCEQEVFNVSARISNFSKAEPRVRFTTDEERVLHKLGISRRRFSRIVNENFDPQSLYSTLTFDDAHEVHTFAEARRVRDLYVRRLLYHAPGARVVIVMGRGKSTSRIHFHMLSADVPEALVHRQWIYGTVLRMEHLRKHCFYDGVDHGQDYTGLANYLFDHWTAEQGGHRWKQSRTMKKPEPQRPTVVKRVYSPDRPPKAPKGYTLIEARGTKFGYLYYKYVLTATLGRRRC